MEDTKQSQANQENQSEEVLISNKFESLEAFNEAMVEPINHTRRELTEGDCLSYL